MIYDLPTSLEINGNNFDINSDFRCILDIIEVLSDREITDEERAEFALRFFYPDFNIMTSNDFKEALEKLFWFINGGEDPQKNKKDHKLMDWEQDFNLIIGPVNRVIGHEVRSDKYLHWWTFLSAYMEIGDCLFSQIVRTRQMIAEGKLSKATKSEKEWYAKNRKLVDFKIEQRYSNAELEFMASFK